MMEDLEYYKQTCEEETKTRIKFETKINSLHSLHRALECRFDRATEDIQNLEKINLNYQREKDQYMEEVNKMRSMKIDLDREIFDQNQLIKKQETEIQLQQDLLTS